MTETTPERVPVEELQVMALFDGESREAAEWIAERMVVRRFDTGDVTTIEGAPAQEFILVLEGELHFQRSGFDSLLIVPAGRATGVLPFSRVKTWGGRGWAAQPTRLGVMEAAHLRELVYRAPILAQRLVAEMTDRTREFTRLQESSNRLLALGKLSAGLAHELNNPASAAVRSAARLREVLTERRTYALALHGQVLPPRVQEIMTELGATISECAATPGSIDPLERADRESDLSDWLETTGVPGELASALVDAGITAEQIQPLATLASSKLLTLGLRILVSDHEIFCLTREVEEAARRISDLVQAVKSYSYMDQSPVAEVDIEEGIDVTLRMFQHQLKHGVQVTRRFAKNLPHIRANGSALNQIWTNLIDNALDSMETLPKEASRELSVRTCTEPGYVLVEIGDNGPGVPEEVQRRIFEPFFTTKPVGDGTGLGLDIVQRIVRSHKGSIRVESRPGRTVFQVRLPI
jgi:signal transduction histidine kinase